MGLLNSNTLNDYITKTIPANARSMWQGVKRIPQDLRQLTDPAFMQGLLSQPRKPLDPNEMAAMGMDYVQPMGGLLAHTVYHGSPHKFDKFDMSKIGIGEGAQAYGHGLYFAESPEVAKSYLKAGGGANQLTVTLPNKQSIYGDQITDKGLEAIKYLEQGAKDAGQFKHNTAYYAKKRTQDPEIQKLIDDWKDAKIGYKDHSTFYKVDIPDESIPRMLDWDKPLSADSPQEVKDAFNSLHQAYPELKDKFFQAFKEKKPGSHYYSLLNDYAKTGDLVKNQSFATDAMHKAGIPGIRYLDGNSRGVGGTSNFVLFDDQLPRILEVNGQPTGLLSYADEAKKAKEGGLLGGNESMTSIYHGTTPKAAKAIEKAGFDIKKSADGTVWFTSNSNIGEVSASGKGAIVKRLLDEKKMKLGGWDEIDKYSVDELISKGYDGVKLEDGGEITYQIFNPEKLNK